MENNTKGVYIISFLRIVMGWVFLWAFLDKVFGLGFATAIEKAWINGGSPTEGFLKFATKGPFVNFYHNLAGSALIDWMFMLGLLFIGTCLVLGIMTKLASSVGFIMVILMYTAGFMPPVNNPVVDDHIIYALLMLLFIKTEAGNLLGLGRWWSQLGFVQRHSILK